MTQKILRSSQALWGAKAARTLGLSDGWVKQSAAKGLSQLREQEKYLRNYFEYLEVNQIPTIGDLVEGRENPLVPYIESPTRRGRTEIEPPPTPPEMTEEEIDAWLLHDPENDEWRRNLFKNL